MKFCYSLILMLTLFLAGCNEAAEMASPPPTPTPIPAPTRTDFSSPTLPDFSLAGYRFGEDPPERVNVVETIHSDSDDDTSVIQAAIDRVSKLEIDASGFRGAIQFAPGVYDVDDTLQISASGIVLTGKNPNGENASIRAVVPRQYILIEVGPDARAVVQKSTAQALSTNALPLGVTHIPVSNPSEFQVGDNVVLTVTPNAAWAKMLGVDRLKEIDPSASNWSLTSFDIGYQRVVQAVTPTAVVLDIGVPTTIDPRYYTAELARYSFPKRIENVGIENLNLISAYDSSITKAPHKVTQKPYFSDENHAFTAVRFMAAAHSWVRKVEALHFGGLIFEAELASKNISFIGCSALDPVSIITGGRRYGFNLGGQLGLVTDCFTRNCRHNFALDSRAAGPNAFVDCRGELGTNLCEPHHRWATGSLYDNVMITGDRAGFANMNRGASAGHGWAGANTVFWNCGAPLFILMQAPTTFTAMVGRDPSIAARNTVYYWADFFNKAAQTNAIVEHSFGLLWDKEPLLESIDARYPIDSLYYTQLHAHQGDPEAQAQLATIQTLLFGNSALDSTAIAPQSDE